jgi:hypothetical protein
MPSQSISTQALKPQHANNPLKSVQGGPHGPARLLIVDDNADMRDYLVHLFGSFYTLRVVLVHPAFASGGSGGKL